MPRALRAVPRATFEDLDAAIDARPPVDDRLVHSLPTSSIRPSSRNPRHRLDVDELAESLRAHGMLQPIVVRRRGAGYELIAGHRRYEAAKRLGWSEIAAMVRDETDEQAYILTLVENLQREDLEPKEEAAALEVLVRERGWSTRQVGEAIKRSPMYVSKRLRVFEDLALAKPVLGNQLTVSTAEELLRVPEEEREEFVKRAVKERWGQAEARHAVEDRKVTLHAGLPSSRLPSHIRALRRELEGLEPDTLSDLARRELALLLKVGQTINAACRRLGC
ncbi:MAG: ParB/RepB/Spo0J family partition protein [Chloroflexota bacterium]|nr:ParB/RepB/Spo0J family partition protein [Chloroflexota bacterium]